MELDPQVKRKPKRNTDAKSAVAAAAQATAQENDDEEASSTTKTQNVQLHMMGFAKDVVLKQRRRMRWRKPTCLGKEEQTSILLCAVGGAVAGSPPPAVDAGREHAGAGASRACVQGGGRDTFPHILRPGLQGHQEHLGQQELPAHAEHVQDGRPRPSTAQAGSSRSSSPSPTTPFTPQLLL